MEPSYGFGSRIAYNTDSYNVFNSEKCLALEPTSPKKKYILTLVALLEKI